MFGSHFHVRRVGSNGGIKWHDAYVFVGRAFTGQPLGFDEVADAHWSVYLGSVLLGKFDEQEHLIHG